MFLNVSMIVERECGSFGGKELQLLSSFKSETFERKLLKIVNIFLSTEIVSLRIIFFSFYALFVKKGATVWQKVQLSVIFFV